MEITGRRWRAGMEQALILLGEAGGGVGLYGGGADEGVVAGDEAAAHATATCPQYTALAATAVETRRLLRHLLFFFVVRLKP